MDDTTKKQLFHMRMQTVLMALIAVILAAGFICAARAYVSLRTAVDTAREKIESVDTEAIEESVKALKEAAGAFSGVDIREFNKAVRSLDDAAKKLGELNIEDVNSIAESLRGTAEKLAKIGNLFGGK